MFTATPEEIADWFCDPSIKEHLEQAEILFAVYDQPSYEGYALVFYIKDNKLYEAYGSHCSCYGLEDQWSPEEGSFAELAQRPSPSDFDHGGGWIPECFAYTEAFKKMQARLPSAKS